MSTIKEEILKTIEQQINSQTSKGVETYGQTLDECPDDAYNWNVMVNEELIDALQYQIKENKRLKEQIKNMRAVRKLINITKIEPTISIEDLFDEGES